MNDSSVSLKKMISETHVSSILVSSKMNSSTHHTVDKIDVDFGIDKKAC